MQKPPRSRFRILFITLPVASLLFFAAFRFQQHEQARAISSVPNSSSRVLQLPATILWAWERPERLDFIDVARVGVAFLAKTIYLRGDRVISRPRLQPLTLPPGARLV